MDVEASSSDSNRVFGIAAILIGVGSAVSTFFLMKAAQATTLQGVNKMLNDEIE